MKKILFSLLFLLSVVTLSNAQVKTPDNDRTIDILISGGLIYSSAMFLGFNTYINEEEKNRDFFRKGSMMFMAVGAVMFVDNVLKMSNKPKNINLTTTQNGVGLIVKF
jgi:hypothetical protein